MDLESHLKLKLRYCSETGKLFWNKIPELNPHDKAFNTKHADREAGCLSPTGYILIRTYGKCLKSHRVAWFLHYGKWPENNIDHLDGIRSNNRIKNLRDVKQTVNGKNCNMNCNNISGVTGVHYCKTRQKWVAQIKVNHKLISLGRYENKLDAINARQEAEIFYGFHESHGRRRAS